MLKQGFLPLRTTLEEYSEGKIILIKPGGNHGDQLIYKGMEKLLDEIGITYDSLNYNMKRNLFHSNINEVPKNLSRAIRKNINKQLGAGSRFIVDELLLDGYDAIVIHGGGNINDVWMDGLRLINNILRNNKHTDVIVAPQTYWFTNENFREFLPKNRPLLKLFCREDYSHALLKNQLADTTVEILDAPDTAFYLKGNDLSAHTLIKSAGEYELIAFRGDREGIASPKMIESIKNKCKNPRIGDISKKSEYSFNEFISIINHASKIYTDRLHVSILGAILEKDVEMYENIYYKNRGVYKRSLSQFENISFNDNYPISESGKMISK